MAIPFQYNLRSVIERWTSTIVAVVSIAGVVAVFIAVLALAHGFQKTLVSSGSPQNVIMLRGGATSEMESAVSLDQIRILQDIDGIERSSQGLPLVSSEVVVVAAFPMKSTGTDANAQVRGVSEDVLQVRDNIRIIEGRFLNPGLNELVVGSRASQLYSGFQLGNTVLFGGSSWVVAGVFDAGGSAFDSEIWCDANNLNQTYKRPQNIFQSVTARLTSEDAFESFKNSVSTDPQLTLSVEREIDFYAKQSESVAILIRVLGFLVASVMAVGAIFGAINTMYSAVSARSVEIATLRALGFRTRHIIISFVTESILISLIGGVVGILLVLPINNSAASTMNWQSFSQLSFSFMITPEFMLEGMLFAVLMGFLGGLFPAVRASRVPIVTALRGL
ncbi:MAG: ABC transporter permease [Deltaproteobacteria bacterium]|nr:ABC transporter permease [Deltaproteobacteria bacterium]